MSIRLKELFEIYLDLKNLNYNFDEKIKRKKPMFTVDLPKILPILPKYEIGELFLIDNFMFLLISETETHYTGFKVTEWVDFATQNDFVFSFNYDNYMAITTELYVDKDNLKAFIGSLDEKFIDVLFEYTVNDKPFPKKYCGLTIPLDDLSYIQNKFRMEELSEVAHYCFSGFLDDDEKVYNISELRYILNDKLSEIELPMAAAGEKNTAVGENYYLHYDHKNKSLKIILNNDFISSENVLKLIFFNDEFLFFPENSFIEFEIAGELPDLEFIKENIKIFNA